jgi:cysteine desulfurase / selenocysteine lyase
MDLASGHPSRRGFLENAITACSLAASKRFVGEFMIGSASVEGLGSRPTAGAAENWRSHFPALDQEVNGQPLIYLDSAATTQRPREVISAITEFYSRNNANPGPTLHALARRASTDLDAARKQVAGFVNSADPLEIVFTRGTTEGVNLVAASWGSKNLQRADEILLCVAEHASNMAPWQLIASRRGANVRFFGIEDSGAPDLTDFKRKLSSRTRIVAISHVSNVLGMINPIQEMCTLAHKAGAVVLVDGAQSVPHFPVDVQTLGCDFLAFSGHKMLGPMGVGILWARRELLEAMPPYQSGSNMAHDVDTDSMHLSEGALRFGAGTPSVADPVGLAAAIRFIGWIGQKEISRHERALTERFIERVSRIAGVRLLGSPDPVQRISVFSFTVDHLPAQEVLAALDLRGIAIRAGDLASLPLLKRLGLSTAARASCYLYTTMDEIDAFASALDEIVRAA